MRKTKWKRSWVVGCLWLGLQGAAPVSAQQAPSTDLDRLLALLVKKGVLAQLDAEGLRTELAEEKVAQQVQAQAARQTQAPPPETSVVARRKLTLSGYGQLRLTSSAGTANTVELRRARFAVGGALTESLSFRLHADFVRSPVLLDANLDYTRFSFAKLRFGQFKVPFSQENLTSSRDLLTVERALPVLGLAPGRDTGNNGRDIGFLSEGSFVRRDGRPLVDYSVGVFNGAGINRRDDNHRKDLAVRVVGHIARGFWVAVQRYDGESGPAQVSRERSEAEFFFRRNKLSFQGEYIWARDGVIHKRGSYTMAAYRFVPKWEGVFPFEEIDPSTRAANDHRHAYLVGINWYASDFTKFQLNYSANQEAARPRLNNVLLALLQFQF